MKPAYGFAVLIAAGVLMTAAPAHAERRDRVGRLGVERLQAAIRKLVGPEHEGLRAVVDALA